MSRSTSTLSLRLAEVGLAATRQAVATLAAAELVASTAAVDLLPAEAAVQLLGLMTPDDRVGVAAPRPAQRRRLSNRSMCCSRSPSWIAARMFRCSRPLRVRASMPSCAAMICPLPVDHVPRPPPGEWSRPTRGVPARACCAPRPPRAGGGLKDAIAVLRVIRRARADHGLHGHTGRVGLPEQPPWGIAMLAPVSWRLAPGVCENGSLSKCGLRHCTATPADACDCRCVTFGGNKAEVIKRGAYGLPSFDGFLQRVLLACR